MTSFRTVVAHAHSETNISGSYLQGSSELHSSQVNDLVWKGGFSSVHTHAVLEYTRSNLARSLGYERDSAGTGSEEVLLLCTPSAVSVRHVHLAPEPVAGGGSWR